VCSASKNIYPEGSSFTMFKRIYDKLAGEVSGGIAFGHVAEISRHHRIQASPGMRAAVDYAVETLRGYGVKAEAHACPANGRDYSWSNLMFKEWSCADAELRLVKPGDEARFLVRYSESKLSLIQRSLPTPRGGVTAEVVALDKGEETRDYEGLDVSGKLVLTDGDVARVKELAVDGRGAVGIIYYGTWVREPNLPEGALDDALKYTSFWWAGEEKPCFGFVLTPRTGRWLRELVKKSKAPVKLHAVVDSKLYDGSIEDAVATIPGETDEEVVVVAHICHPQPSANDNASGSAAAMEAARALHKLIGEGELPKPRRTMRFTLVPEMAGSYAWLSENEERIPDIVAAINLDMVGENQDLCGSPLVVERTPEATPSYVNSLVEAIYGEVKREAGNLGGSAKYPLFRHAVAPFSGGSDHYVYSDPTVGVPCPMLIQWPDRFWHTSYDTLDKVDPGMLRRVALMTATYAYFIADAGPAEAIWLASETATREKASLISRIQGEVTRMMDSESDEVVDSPPFLSEKAEYWTGRATEAVRSVWRLAPKDRHIQATMERLSSEIEASGRTSLRQAERTLREHADAGKKKLIRRRRRANKLEREAADITPKRLFRGPVSTRPWLRRLSAEDREAYWRLGREHRDSDILGTLAMYWTDGRRSLLEVSRLVELEAGRTDLEYLVEYYRLLGAMGLVGLGEG
jgi:aminopeptidase YwaD